MTEALPAHTARISMDIKGSYQNSIFVERLWVSEKYECVYLKTFKAGAHLPRNLQRDFACQVVQWIGTISQCTKRLPHDGPTKHFPCSAELQ